MTRGTCAFTKSKHPCCQALSVPVRGAFADLSPTPSWGLPHGGFGRLKSSANCALRTSCGRRSFPSLRPISPYPGSMFNVLYESSRLRPGPVAGTALPTLRWGGWDTSVTNMRARWEAAESDGRVSAFARGASVGNSPDTRLSSKGLAVAGAQGLRGQSASYCSSASTGFSSTPPTPPTPPTSSDSSTPSSTGYQCTEPTSAHKSRLLSRSS
jgi:hypothetical protein